MCGTVNIKKPHTKVNLLDVGGPCVVGFEGIPGVVFVVGPAVFGVVMGGSPGVVMGVDFAVVACFCQQLFYTVMVIIIWEMTYW